MELDNIDIAILDLLEKDGRVSNREVGRALQISEGTVRQRLKKLTECKAFRLGLVTDMESGGLTASGIARIKTLPNCARTIAEKIAQIESCTFVGLVLGRYDLVAIFVCETRFQIAEVINNHVANLPGVISMDVREPVGFLKHRYELIHIV